MSTSGSSEQQSYEQLLASLESLVPENAEAMLVSLASALFPSGAGTINQLTWEGDGGPVAVPSGTTAQDDESANAERKLRAADLRYRTLVEQIPAVTFIAVLGEGENEVYVNPQIESLLGFTQKEWLENPFLWYSQLYPDDRPLLYEEFARGCQTGGPFKAECRLIARDGRIVWVRGEARLIKDELGRPLFLQGVAFDVTESKRAEALLVREAITTTEQRYRDLVEQVGAIFWEADIVTPGFTFVSRGAERILGFPAERWTESPDFWLSRVHVDDRRAVGDALRNVRTGQTAVEETEFRAITADGRTVWLHQRAYVFRPLAGDPRMIGMIADVTDRRRVEEILRQHAEHLAVEANIGQTLHRIGTQLASELTLERVVQLATDEATSLTQAGFGAFFYNLTNEQGESYTLYTLSGVPREEFANFPMPRNTAVFGPTFRGEGIVRLDDVTKDPRYGQNAPHHGMPKGHLPVKSYLAVPVISRSGEVLGGMFFGHAEAGRFTAEHERLAAGIAGWTALAIDNARLYSAVENAREAAEAANRAKDEFLATMSHELRTPLNAVLGWVQLLRNGSAAHGSRERALATIERNARAQAQIIDDLLDVSRIVTGKLALTISPVDLIGILDASLEGIKLAVTAKELTIVKDYHASAAMVAGDANRLRQVVTNLLTNAVKFTPQGGRIEVCLDTVDGHAQVRVSDNGQGIDPQLLPRVFERFWQADSSTTRTHGGLGLGLAIVRHIIEMHGGRVSAASAGAGRGATFIVELPLTASATTRPSESTESKLPKDLIAPLHNARVIVVDDEADSRDLIASLLLDVGADVVSVGSVAEALRAIYERTPELVICDLGMPYADGFDLLRHIRSMGGTAATIPVIAVTAYARDEDRERALSAGFQAHVGKPFDTRRLLTTAAEWVARANDA
jgi:PAS domain S-box-containing protein